MTGPEVTQPDPDGGVEMTDGEWAAFRGVEVTAAMKAEDVDAALVEKARKVLMQRGPSQGAEPYPLDSDDSRTAEWVEGWREAWLAMPEVLAAVLPEIQAQAQQDLIADLLARDLWDVRYAINEYPIRAVPKSELLDRRNRLARRTAKTEEPTDG